MTINKNYKIKFLLQIFLMPAFMHAFSNVKLPAIFSDHMVFQQKSKVAMWGWADPREKIIVTGSWSNKNFSTITKSNGEWKVMVNTPAAGGPYSVKIRGQNTIELKDVLIGEVWVCSGQSNMVFSLNSSYKAKEEIAVADFENIRYFSVKRQYGREEFKDAPGSVWLKTSLETAPSFSAVAYYFAKKIHQQLNVPVGIVYAAWGGTPAEAWAPSSTLKSDSVLYLPIKRWKEMYVTVGKDSVAYRAALDKWNSARKSGDSIKLKKPEEPATVISYNRPWREPSVLFNGMINPVIPYTIKGVLWYQGESNVSYANEYYHLFSSMIKGWREKWNNLNLPFYFVQIAPFNYSKMDAAAQLRDAQYQVMKNISNTGMAVTVDVGEMKNQHFTRKKEVGERLALIALAKEYRYKKINYKGPEIKNAYVENGKVILEFESSFLLMADTLKGFEIGYRISSGDSTIFIKALATLEGNKVIVWNDKVKEPLEVRYAWLLAGEANLFDKEGLPAFPFRKMITNLTGF
ncbi:MAG: sialate O-acetylesterase [Chitinophagaceae bacterium]